MNIKLIGCLIVLVAMVHNPGNAQTYKMVDQVPAEPVVVVGTMFSEKESMRKPLVKAWRQDAEYIVYTSHEGGALQLSHRFDHKISVSPNQKTGYHRYDFYRKIDPQAPKSKNISICKSPKNSKPDRIDIVELNEEFLKKASDRKAIFIEDWPPSIRNESSLSALIDSAYLCGFEVHCGGTYTMNGVSETEVLELARKHQFGIVTVSKQTSMGDSQYGFYYFTTFSRKDDSTYISVTQVRSDPYYEEILLAYKDLKPDFLIYTSTDGIILNYGRQLSHSMIPYQEIDIGEEVQLHLFLKGYLGTTLTIKRLALHEFTVNGHVLTKESFNVYRAASTALHYWLRYYGDCQEPARVQGTTTRTSRSIDSLQILQTGMNTYSAFGTIRLTCEQEYNNQRGQVPPVREQVNYPFRLDIAIEEEESTIFNIEVDHNHYDSTQFYYQYFSLPSSWATVFDESNRWSHSLKVNGN